MDRIITPEDRAKEKALLKALHESKLTAFDLFTTINGPHSVIASDVRIFCSKYRRELESKTS